jgi:hypothetical protein
MPTFDHSTDIDIDVYEFYESMTKHDKEEMIELFIEDGLYTPQLEIQGYGYDHQLFQESINKLATVYHRLSSEEIDKIIDIAKKY